MRRASFLFVSAFALPVVIACGGKVVAVGAGPDAGPGGSCVNIDPSTYDTSCTQDLDCIPIPSGELCTGSCGCEGATINVQEQGRFTADTASIALAKCFCPRGATPRCVQNSCTLCTGPNPPSGCLGTDTDASIPPSDAGMCVNIDVSTYDRSCTQDPDCIGVTPGEICTGGCSCGGSAINRSGQARYDAAVNSIQTLACPCTPAGPIRCLAGQCTQCSSGPNAPPGCDDGG